MSLRVTPRIPDHHQPPPLNTQCQQQLVEVDDVKDSAGHRSERVFVVNVGSLKLDSDSEAGFTG